MDELLRKLATPLPGVIEALNYFKENGKKIGLATSSYTVLINAILETMGITDYFEVVWSAENELYGKPHPAVYLTTAEKLGVHPKKCLVIEDSLNGIISGKAAKMSVICIPEKTHFPEPKLMLADMQFGDMNEMIHFFEENR
jgi:sugar-phosphatase